MEIYNLHNFLFVKIEYFWCLFRFIDIFKNRRPIIQVSFRFNFEGVYRFETNGGENCVCERCCQNQNLAADTGCVRRPCIKQPWQRCEIVLSLSLRQTLIH
jgi:hypothetical protein